MQIDRDNALLPAVVGSLGTLIGHAGDEAHLVERFHDRRRRDVVLDVVRALDLAAPLRLVDARAAIEPVIRSA